MNLLAWCPEGSLDLWAFQDSAKVCVEHLVHGEVVVTPEEAALCQVPYSSSNLGKALAVQTQERPTRPLGASFKMFRLLTLSRV